MRSHTAMATPDPQKYVIAGKFWAENMLLVSGRLFVKKIRLREIPFRTAYDGICKPVRARTVTLCISTKSGAA